MVPDTTSEAELAAALARGMTRHRGRRWRRPARSPLVGASARCHGQSLGAGPLRRVLCVDRHQPLADSLAGTLRQAGFDVRCCTEGAVALVQITNFRPHACVLDMETPGVGGCELARWVRSELGELVYLVGLADLTGDDLDALAAEAGFDLILARPPDADLLIGLIAGPGGRAPLPRAPSL